MREIAQNLKIGVSCSGNRSRSIRYTGSESGCSSVVERVLTKHEVVVSKPTTRSNLERNNQDRVAARLPSTLDLLDPNQIAMLVSERATSIVLSRPGRIIARG